MSRNLSKSNAHFRKARQHLPLGVASTFRYWGDEETIYVKRARGGRLWDLDGNEYVDYRLGYGPCILGYADPRVDAAAIEGQAIGGVFALGTEREYSVAKRIGQMVPSAERVRFSNSGSEAVMAALRLARACSGRDSYILVEGGYHGVFDAALWQVEVEDWDGGDGEPPLEPYGAGVPKVIKQLVHTVPLNDANALEHVLARHHNDIGALLIEPIMGNCCGLTAQVPYMQAVRELCDRYDVVLIIDEVKTGFRVARGGVQELMGISADLCTFAKAMGNGYPIAALAGRERFMRRIEDDVVHGGTFTAHSISLAAAEKTLEILDETDALAQIENYGQRLRKGLGEILDAHGVAHCFTGHPALSGLFFSDRAPDNYRDWKQTDYTFYDTMAPALHDQGVLVEPDSREPWFLCEAHDEACLRHTLEGFAVAVEATRRKLAKERGS